MSVKSTTGVASLRTIFERGRPVIPFLTAGYPSERPFLDATLAAAEAGAGALEIGMPFSDPLADGPVIQHTSQAVLDRGMTLPHVLELAEQAAARTGIPVILMGYLNPLLQMGLERFAGRCAAAGVAGTIIPDCPIEEAVEWRDASARHGLANIFLIAPTSTDKRIARIDRAATAFSYCVSVAGVTGARTGVSAATKSYLRRVRGLVQHPFVVGFGISKPDHIRMLRPLADGFVVGSALVPLLDNPKTGPARVRRMIATLVKAAG